MDRFSHVARAVVTFAALASCAACSVATGSDDVELGNNESVASESAALVAPVARGRQQAVGDFTGDGYADCARLNTTTGYFSVYANLRNGQFAASPFGVGRVNNLPHEETFVADFTGDKFADFADHLWDNGSSSSGPFLIYNNDRAGGYYQSSNWGAGSTTVGSNWETLIGDFTGDGFADYADHNLSNGGFYIHRNLQNGTFAGWGVNWGSGKTQAGSGWETLVADFTGDGFTDYADHSLSTGELWIHQNLHNGTFAEPGTTNLIWGYGKSTVTAPYVTLVGDFTGDGYADYIDYNTTTGAFYIHQNLQDGTFAGWGQNWGSGVCPNWLGYVSW